MSEHSVAIARALILAALVALLPACSETHTLRFQTAAAGTRIEAKEVVAFVYAQAPDGRLENVLYSVGDLAHVIKRLRDRYPQLKPWLDHGAIGNTASGFVALRDESRRQQLRDLLRDENRDRAFLHDRASVAVGHGGDDLASWLPYASYAFGAEWIAQGQPGWWWMDEQRRWQQK